MGESISSHEQQQRRVHFRRREDIVNVVSGGFKTKIKLDPDVPLTTRPRNCARQLTPPQVSQSRRRVGGKPKCCRRGAALNLFRRLTKSTKQETCCSFVRAALDWPQGELKQEVMMSRCHIEQKQKRRQSSDGAFDDVHLAATRRTKDSLQTISSGPRFGDPTPHLNVSNSSGRLKNGVGFWCRSGCRRRPNCWVRLWCVKFEMAALRWR